VSIDRGVQPRKALPSILTSGLSASLKVLLALSALMIANTLYLLLNRLGDGLNWTTFAANEFSLPKLFQAMVLVHTGLGIVVVVVMLGFAIAHLPKVWRRRHIASVWSGVLFVVLGIAVFATGLLILTAAASRNNSWAWWTHVVCGLLVVAGYVSHRVVSHTKPVSGQFFKFSTVTVGLVAVLVIAHTFTHRDVVRTEEARLAFEKGLNKGPGAKERDVKKYNEEAFTPEAFVPPQSPFFPSAATTTTGANLPARIITAGDLGSQDKIEEELERNGFVMETLIGAETCERCHQDIVEQWAASAHRFASFNNPFYEATLEDLRKSALEPNAWIDEHLKHFSLDKDQVGMVKSKWCSGCHDPALMLAGKMDQKIDRNLPDAQAGLTCLACHAMDKIHNQTGNGNYNIADEQEDPYLFADAKDGTVAAFLHDAALKAKPTVHIRQMIKPFFTTPEYCATCHKVSLSQPVNNYRWLRGQDEYTNWHDSGVALNAARTFYLPPTKRQCQTCHMPLEPAPLGDLAANDGMVKSHRFIAVNTALPFLRNDQETIKRIENFLRYGKIRVDVFALKSQKMDQPVMNIHQNKPAISGGEKVTVDVVIRNEGVGHTFPGGTNDSNEGWLEFTLTDEKGNLLAISGAIGENGHLDPMAHVFKSLIVDKHGKPLHKRNAQNLFATVYSNVIGPGTADIAHYEFVLPDELSGLLTIKARLLWRKFDRKYTEFAFKANPVGFKRFDSVPDLPITEIASDEVTLAIGNVEGNAAAAANDDNPLKWIRYNDYGIGLLLEKDTRGATLAFQEVAKLQPESIEGSLNLAKTAVQDGNLDKVYDHLKKCEELQPGDPRVAWVWGVALQEDGQYEKAVMAYKRVLEKFPEDRATWLNLGRTYYLDRQYETSLETYAVVLKIDPENRIAHYHRMLCLRALGREKEAEIASAAYSYYQIDESASEVTRDYKIKNPGANIMAQAIKTHKLKFRKPGLLGLNLKK